MFDLAVANLVVPELEFEVPSCFGTWNFERTGPYKKNSEAVEDGMCANTYSAAIAFNMSKRTDEEFEQICQEFISLSLILSWLTAKCVTSRQSMPGSDVSFLSMGDDFLRPRGIVGFKPVPRTAALTQLFTVGLPHLQATMQNRRLTLMMTHWLSGLTCFSIEDLFLSACVQMDIVKQCENAKTYFDGMRSASSRYKLKPLGRDFKSMRNDLVHEGVLSGSNYPRKTKHDCAGVVADVLNWIDRYFAAVLGMNLQSPDSRWDGGRICHGLPSFSVKS
jgi:hypothetical protein